MKLCIILALLAVSQAGPASRQLHNLARGRFDKIDYPNCGKRHVLANNGVNELGTRIVGGAEAVAHSWPAICSFRLTTSPNFHMCGGNLIKNLAGAYFFLTAAHCISATRADAYIANCGIHDRTSAPATRVVIHFSNLHVHGSYSSTNMDYDIAIMKVTTNLPTNNYIDAVCLPNENWSEGEKAIVAGWGTLSSGGSSPYNLHQVTKPIKSRETCKLRYGAAAITNRMLCAGLPQGGIDSCQGDSGGPLYTYRQNRWTLTGIVSWGYGCAAQNRPGVYTDVIELKDWIGSLIN